MSLGLIRLSGLAEPEMPALSTGTPSMTMRGSLLAFSEEPPRMRLERHHPERCAQRRGFRAGPGEHRLVTDMDAVEISDGDHGSAILRSKAAVAHVPSHDSLARTRRAPRVSRTCGSAPGPARRP